MPSPLLLLLWFTVGCIEYGLASCVHAAFYKGRYNWAGLLQTLDSAAGIVITLCCVMQGDWGVWVAYCLGCGLARREVCRQSRKVAS